MGISLHTSRFDQFGGIQFSFNEYYQNALKVYAQALIGIQHHNPIVQIRVEKGWFHNETLSVGLTFEDFYHSWDNMEYYFARQEAEERGGKIDISHKFTDNAKISTEISRKFFTTPEEAKMQSKDKGFINALSLKLENQGRILHEGEYFFSWYSQIYVTSATEMLKGDYSYKALQINFYPQIYITPKQILDFSLHWGVSSGNVPAPRLFSLGGDKTLPGYNDDAFIGKNVILMRSGYKLQIGNWLKENSRLFPLNAILLFDIGDVLINNKHKNFGDFKYETGLELNYDSIVRVGFVKSLGKYQPRDYIYFGWNTHLIRPQL